MKTLIVLAALLLLTACAGITSSVQHNEMFNPGDEAEGQPAIKHAPTFAPSAEVLALLPPEKIAEVLMAFANAAGQWMTYAPTWTQTIGSDIENQGQLEARLRAQIAKEIEAALAEDPE